MTGRSARTGWRHVNGGASYVCKPCATSPEQLTQADRGSLAASLAHHSPSMRRHPGSLLALRQFGQRVVHIEHPGSYACRNVDGDPHDRRASVASAWSAGGADAQFVRELHDGACPFFDGVLGSEYNAAHHDHFHLDRGSYGLCR